MIAFRLIGASLGFRSFAVRNGPSSGLTGTVKPQTCFAPWRAYLRQSHILTLRGRALLLMVKQKKDDYSLLLPELDLLWLTTVAFSPVLDQAELSQFDLKVFPVRQAKLRSFTRSSVRLFSATRST